MKVIITDVEYANVDMERELLQAAGFEVEQHQCRTPEEVVRAARGAQALIVQYARITRDVLEQLPELRLISRYGVGVDSVDLAAAQAAGVWVANVPDYCISEVASHALAMALALVRHLPAYDRDIRQGRWHFLSSGPLRRPSALSFGMLGVGRIGRAVAAQAGPIFGQLLGHDPYLPAEQWPARVTRVGLQELFARSAVLSLHVPLNEETRGMVGRDLLASMQPGSFLVNTARGDLVDLNALYAALDSGQLAGAALDVLPQEPPHPGDPILDHQRVLLSPHAAFYSAEAELELRRKAALNVIAWAQEGRPLYPVVEGGGHLDGTAI